MFYKSTTIRLMTISATFAPEYDRIRAKLAEAETPDQRAELYDDVDVMIKALDFILARRVRKHLGGIGIELDQRGGVNVELDHQEITNFGLIAQARAATEQ